LAAQTGLSQPFNNGSMKNVPEIAGTALEGFSYEPPALNIFTLCNYAIKGITAPCLWH